MAAVCACLLLALAASCARTPPVVNIPAPMPAVKAEHTTDTAIVTILHTNDMHGMLTGESMIGSNATTFEFGGIANVMGTISRIKSELSGNVLVIDAGDLWQGTFASNRDEGRAIVAAMNVVGYDAAVPGNHDFDHGQAVLAARSSEANFPFLAANIADQSTRRPPAWAVPYVIKPVAGVNIGIIGLANSATPVITKAANSKGLVFRDEIEAALDAVSQISTKVDLIIVVSHGGIDIDQMIAQKVPGIDVIVGGHSHAEIEQPRLEGNTVIVQAGAKAQYVGRLDLVIDRGSKRIVDYGKTTALVPAVSSKATTPQAVSEMMTTLVADSQEALIRPLGETRTDLLRAFTPDGRTTGEYPLGNLVVDAMLASNQAGDRPADCAMHNQGVRADLKRGAITYGKLYQAFPFDNRLAAIDLTGAQIKSILETAVSCPRVNILVAGMSFTFDCSKARGTRVSGILIQRQPLQLDRSYRVQTIDYLVAGGDGLTPFTQGKNIAYGDPVVDVLADYIQQHSPLEMEIEGRIVAAGQK